MIYTCEYIFFLTVFQITVPPTAVMMVPNIDPLEVIVKAPDTGVLVHNPLFHVDPDTKMDVATAGAGETAIVY